MNEYRNSQINTKTFFLIIRGKTAKLSHVTGQRSLRGRGSRKGLQRAPTNTMLFSDYHLAKLNPNCHKNYLDYL